MSDNSNAWRNGCIISCVGCAGLIVLVVGGVAWMFLWSQREVAPAAMDFLDAIEEERYREAHAMMGQEWRDEHPLDEFIEEWERRRERLGPRQSIGSRGFSFNVGDEGTTARTRYSAQYERGRANIEFDLERRDGGWFPTDLWFEEVPELEPLGVPESGEPVDATSSG